MTAAAHVSYPSDGVGLVLLDDPPKNFGTAALAVSILKGLKACLEHGCRVVVLASDVPGYFMAHWSLEEILALPREYSEPKRPGLFDAIELMPLVVIAANHGQAWGGGSELSWACDLRIAGESATYGQPEVALGLIPGGGGTTRLARLIGVGRCMELVLDARPVSARRAWEMGAVNRVVPDASLREESLKWAGEIARWPGYALAAAKKSVVEGRDLPIAAARRNEERLFWGMKRRDEAVEILETSIGGYRAGKDSWRVLGFGS